MTHSPETRQRVIDAYFAGEQLNSIANRYGIARSVIHKWRRESGLRRRDGSVDGTRQQKFDRDDLKIWHKQGLSDGDIASILQVSRAAIREARVGLGLPANFPARFQVFALTFLLFKPTG